MRIFIRIKLIKLAAIAKSVPIIFYVCLSKLRMLRRINTFCSVGLKAKFLLQQRQLSIAEIASQVGFCDQSPDTLFKRSLGVTRNNSSKLELLTAAPRTQECPKSAIFSSILNSRLSKLFSDPIEKRVLCLDWMKNCSDYRGTSGIGFATAQLFVQEEPRLPSQVKITIGTSF